MNNFELTTQEKNDKPSDYNLSHLKYSQVILYLTLTMLLFVLVFITQKSLNIQQLYKIIIITLVIGIITTLVLLWLIYKIKNIIEEKQSFLGDQNQTQIPGYRTSGQVFNDQDNFFYDQDNSNPQNNIVKGQIMPKHQQDESNNSVSNQNNLKSQNDE